MKDKTIVIGDNYVGTAFKDTYIVWNASELQDRDSTEWRNILCDVRVIIYAVDNKTNCIKKNWVDNFEFLYHLFEFGKKFNIKIVLISTAELYGNNWDWDNQTSEDSTFLDMNNDYRLSRRVAERLLKNSDALILRIKNPFDDTPVVGNILYDEFTKEPPCGWQDSYTYLPDLVKCTQFLIDNEHSGIYNIVQPQAASMVYLYKNVLQIPQYLELDGDAFENSAIDTTLSNDRVCSDVNATKIQKYVDLIPLDAAVSLAWEGIKNMLTTAVNGV